MRNTISAGGLAALFATAGITGCAANTGEPAPAAESIVDGTRETGYPSVMLLENRSDFRGTSMCTSALVSPRLVLTARHCVMIGQTNSVASASSISVFVGSSYDRLTARYDARAIHIIPGSTQALRDGNAYDLAFVELESPAAETPMEIATDSPRTLLRTDVTAIGFGDTPEGNFNRTKFRTTARITSYEYGVISVDPSVCQGDSGGPMIGSDGKIYGVASFIQSADGVNQPECGTAPGAYNDLYVNMAWVRRIFMDVEGICMPDARGEICDGMDNDCDGEADEDCRPIGGACSVDADCGRGTCVATSAGSICTEQCDPMRPTQGCDPGFYCGMHGCTGYCVPGTPGSAPIGAACTADVECASAYCADPGDGEPRCLPRCQLDAGRCLAGEVCVPLADACGACVDQDLLDGSGHGVGEPCGSDADCRSGMCRESGGFLECASACATTSECPAGFACRDGGCVRRRADALGSSCTDDEDCASGICARAGDRRWCTSVCESDANCPGAFTCSPASGVTVCAPAAALPGESCGSDADCVTGLCAIVGGSGTCVDACSAEDACGAGFECRRTSDGAGSVCTRPRDGGGGCAVAAGSRGAGLMSVLPLLAALGLALRRRAR